MSVFIGRIRAFRFICISKSMGLKLFWFGRIRSQKRGLGVAIGLGRDLIIKKLVSCAQEISNTEASAGAWGTVKAQPGYREHIWHRSSTPRPL